MTKMSVRQASALLFAMASIFPLSAYAYLDPGTGSAILQGLIAALSAVLVAGHLYWSRFLELLGRGKKKQGDADAEEKAKPEDFDSKVG